MMSSLNPPRPAIFDDSPERHPGNSSEDGPLLHPPANLSEVWGMGPLDRLCLGP